MLKIECEIGPKKQGSLTVRHFIVFFTKKYMIYTVLTKYEKYVTN